ncbi:MAG: SPFH domain-containing protein [Oligoflexales bacterium]
MKTLVKALLASSLCFSLGNLMGATEGSVSGLIDSMPASSKKFIKTPDEGDLLDRVHHFDTLEKTLRWAYLTVTPWNFCRHAYVQEDEVALVRYNDKYNLKGRGFQFILSPWSSIEEKKKIHDSIITHGPITSVRIKDGELGYALNTLTGDPILLAPGFHYMEDPNIIFKGLVDLKKSVNNLDNYTLLRIGTGRVGVVYKDDGLEILSTGLHLIRQPDYLRCIASTQQEIVKLDEGHYTSGDNVGLKINADVFYILNDPETAFEKGFESIDDITKTLKDQAIATLVNIVRREQFANIGQSGSRRAKQKEVTEEGKEDLKIDFAKFFKNTHDQFVDELQETFGDTYGIQIENIRILSIDFADQKLAESIMNNAILYAQTKSQLENIESQQEINTKRAEYEKAVKIIESEGESQAAINRAQGKGESMKIEAQMKAEQIRILAEANAEKVRLAADAEKYSIERKAEAKQDYARKLGETELGGQMTLYDIQAQALKNTRLLVTERIPNLVTGGLFGLDKSLDLDGSEDQDLEISDSEGE